MEDITKPTPEIALFAKEWARNRHLIAGEDAVKGALDQYITRPGGVSYMDDKGNLQLTKMTDEDFQKYLDRTPFFAAAAATADFWKGMVFRKAPARSWAKTFDDLANTITVEGNTIDDLAEELFNERVVAPFVGLLLDYPRDDGTKKNAANAFALGFRPFVSLYRAESVLEVRARVYRNKRVVDRVRLLEGEDVRELLLNFDTDVPVYQQIMWTKPEGTKAHVASDPITVRVNGKTLDSIPFRLSTGKARAIVPHKAPITDLVLANIQHFRVSAALATSNHYVAHPIAVITGSEPVANLSINPGVVWQFDKSEANAKYLEVSGKNDSLIAAIDKIESQMAKLGSQVLAPEKTGVEAAETLALRSASERASLGAIARSCSRDLTEILGLAAEWCGMGEVQYTLNTDYVVIPMSPQEFTIYKSMRDSGDLSRRTLYEIMIYGEILPEGFDPQDELDRLAEETPDAPTGPGLLDTPDDGSNL